MSVRIRPLAFVVGALALLLTASDAVAQAQPSGAIRIEHRIFGDRIVRADGSLVARTVTARSLASAVAGVPRAEELARRSIAENRVAQRWGALAAIAGVVWLLAENNGMSEWEEGDRTAFIYSSVAVGLVAGTVGDRYTRAALTSRGAAIEAFNAARAR